MKTAIAYPELPLFEPEKKVTKKSTGERSRDSEGRYAAEGQIPDHKTFVETQERRTASLYRLLRIKDEEIIRLKEELKKMKKYE
jgi:hypothetical protein